MSNIVATKYETDRLEKIRTFVNAANEILAGNILAEEQFKMRINRHFKHMGYGNKNAHMSWLRFAKGIEKSFFDNNRCFKHDEERMFAEIERNFRADFCSSTSASSSENNTNFDSPGGDDDREDSDLDEQNPVADESAIVQTVLPVVDPSSDKIDQVTASIGSDKENISLTGKRVHPKGSGASAKRVRFSDNVEENCISGNPSVAASFLTSPARSSSTFTPITTTQLVHKGPRFAERLIRIKTPLIQNKQIIMRYPSSPFQPRLNLSVNQAIKNILHSVSPIIANPNQKEGQSASLSAVESEASGQKAKESETTAPPQCETPSTETLELSEKDSSSVDADQSEQSMEDSDFGENTVEEFPAPLLVQSSTLNAAVDNVPKESQDENSKSTTLSGPNETLPKNVNETVEHNALPDGKKVETSDGTMKSDHQHVVRAISKALVQSVETQTATTENGKNDWKNNVKIVELLTTHFQRQNETLKQLLLGLK